MWKQRLDIADISTFVTLHTPSISHLLPPSSYVSLAHGTHICASREQQSQGIEEEVSIGTAMACLKGSGGFSAGGRKLEHQHRTEGKWRCTVGIWLTSIPHTKTETSSIYV